MNENMMSRIGRIISGSANAVVNAVENTAPEIVLEQTLREIDGAIDEVRTELGKTAASKHLASQRLITEQQKHQDLSEQACLAVKQQRDDLAEAAIAEQLDIEVQIPVLQSTLEDCEEREQKLENYINALQGRRREMQREISLYQREQEQWQTQTTQPGRTGANNSAAKVARAEAAFERVLGNASGLAGTVHISSNNAEQLAELETLSRHHRIKERLTLMKSSRVNTCKVNDDGQV